MSDVPIQFNARGDIGLTIALKQYARRKALKLVKFVPESEQDGARFRIEFETEKERDIARLHFTLPGQRFKAEAEAEGMYEAIDRVQDRMKRKLHDYHERLIDENRKEGRRLKEKLRSSNSDLFDS